MIDVDQLRATIGATPGNKIAVDREQLLLISRELALGNAARLALAGGQPVPALRSEQRA
ncbi:hypothetical protein [Sphingomonas koreensis]|uniref:hypothetical protein n=1 Tax=Sphingomonas koreensis TaxID=93064 RepID=UPI0013DE1147|nr:hypothetical protein [Sphingomonas koreensis]MDC7809955.1 hypothetical protein [Sphingomonas koreensis]